MKKTLTMVLALVLVFALGVGGTLAWLSDDTDPVVNTFTVGDINIDLAETVNPAFDFVPGDVLAKDPKVTVEATSEDCYLFIKVIDANNTITDANNNNKIVNWTVDTSVWTAVPGHDGFWYKEVTKGAGADGFAVFTDGIANDDKDGSVTVSTEVTKDMVAGLKTNKPTITVTAAAVQKDNVANVTVAWGYLPTAFTGASAN